MPDVSSICPKRIRAGDCLLPLHGVVFDIFGWEPATWRRDILLEAAHSSEACSWSSATSKVAATRSRRARGGLARPALCSRSRLIIEWQRRKRTFKRGLACCSAIGAPDEIRTPRFGNRLGNVGVSGPSMTNSQPRASSIPAPSVTSPARCQRPARSAAACPST